MRKGNVHIIQTQSIEINFENPENNLVLQNRMAELFYEKLQPRMAMLFDEMAGRDQAVYIDSLEIDCGVLPAGHWEEVWIETVLRKLKDQIRGADRTAAPHTIAGDFFFFLEHGRLPWNSSVSSIKDFEEAMILNTGFFIGFKKNIRKEAFIKRLVNQFSAYFVNKLVQALQKETVIKGMLYPAEPGQSLDRKQQEIILMAFIKQNALQQAANNEATGDEKKINKAGADGTSKNMQKKRAENDPAQEHVFINNAGLILLHPFLPVLFEELGLTEEKKWVSEEAQQRAVLITAFLVSGETAVPEFNLSLNKLLCGVEMTAVLPEPRPIDPFTQKACEELLAAVIAQWSSLKNTSMDGLRDAFLQRNGKLSMVDKGWLLQVEQKGLDVLLNKLPWGIGVIKLPWMKELLHTEWNS